MKNRVQLKSYIRFQLSQMSARNEHHTWENATFELARQTVTPHLLPATGPVQAGGDQGRDFESFRTYIAKTFEGRAWVGRGGTDVLAFACTLNKKLAAKIKSDLASIFAGGEKPAVVYYYAEPDLPVAERHKLQQFCVDTYAAKLEIFDGQAIADQLADPNTFWIAEQFFSVPADMYPPVKTDEEYATLRAEWLERDVEPSSYADFVDVKRGLRRSSRDEDVRKDLPAWMALMRQLTEQEPPALKRKALYEILVAQLKGRGVLDSEKAIIVEFFGSLPEAPTAEQLEDAAVALSFVTTAARIGAFQIEAAILSGWRDAVSGAVEAGLSTAGRTTARRYVLLLSRAQLVTIDVLDPAIRRDLGPVVGDWRDALKIAKENPFCDIEHFTGIIGLLTPLFGDVPEFQDFVDEFDSLIALRDGAAAAGERARDRAITLFEAGKNLAAIDQLQRAKEGWFSAETMTGSITAALMLAETYRVLHLPWAARLYASAAQMVANEASDDDSRPYIARAGFEIAASFFHAGEALSYLGALRSALNLHLALLPDPTDLKRHGHIATSLTHVAQIRAVMTALEPHLVQEVDRILETWPLDPNDRELLLKASDETAFDAKGARRLISRDLGYDLTTDLGTHAHLDWRALGIRWVIDAEQGLRLQAEQLAAILQVIQADIGEIDLLIIPTTVELRLAPQRGPLLRLQPEPGNSATTWTVGLPASFNGDRDHQVEMSLVVVLTVLEQVSALSSTRLREIVERRMKRGLMNRAFWVAPSDLLLEQARQQAGTGIDLTALTAENPSSPVPLEAEELAWRDGPAEQYSAAAAQEHLENRYRRMAAFGAKFVPLILKNDEAAQAIRALHAEGMKDWRILAILFNLALQHEAVQLNGPLQPQSRDAAFEYMKPALDAGEAGELKHFDPTIYTAEAIGLQRTIQMAAIAGTWKLRLPGPTPDFDAIEKLLDARFGLSSDDIDHEDIFGWGTPPTE